VAGSSLGTRYAQGMDQYMKDQVYMLLGIDLHRYVTGYYALGLNESIGYAGPIPLGLDIS
jgi:hypothetical protein